jgi:tripartite-type tricarboxylate transporter receptor subunit TctC
MNPSCRRAILTAVASSLVTGLAVFAQTPAAFPTKPVTIMVPVPAGGLQDGLARAFALQLSKLWKQSVVVDNRVGASGAIAIAALARAAPDGYTLSTTDNASLVTTQILKPSAQYEIFKDLVPVSGIAEGSNVLLVHAASPIQNLGDLIALAKAKPGTVNYGSFGIGTSNHLDTENLAKVAGVKFVHIPYKGGTEVLQALMTNDQITFAITGASSALPYVKQGSLRAIANGGSTRSAVFAAVPTFAELGLTGFESTAWFGLYAPAKTPKIIIDKIAGDIDTILKDKDFVDRSIVNVGLKPMELGPKQSLDLLKEDYTRYTEKVKLIGGN